MNTFFTDVERFGQTGFWMDALGWLLAGEGLFQGEEWTAGAKSRLTRAMKRVPGVRPDRFEAVRPREERLAPDAYLQDGCTCRVRLPRGHGGCADVFRHIRQAILDGGAELVFIRRTLYYRFADRSAGTDRPAAYIFVDANTLAEWFRLAREWKAA